MTAKLHWHVNVFGSLYAGVHDHLFEIYATSTGRCSVYKFQNNTAKIHLGTFKTVNRAKARAEQEYQHLCKLKTKIPTSQKT